MLQNTTGTNNSAIGLNSLALNLSGSNNTAVGSSALFFNTASDNTAVGFEAGYSNTSATGNTAMGYRSLKDNNGNYNTAYGWQSASANTTGDNLSIFGANQQTGNFSQTSMVGVGDTATGNNQFRFGSASIVNGAVNVEVNASSKVWNVFINGVAQKILLA
jgi:hypothetical protein